MFHRNARRLVLGLLLAFPLQTMSMAGEAAAAEVEWHDCYAPYNHWRFASEVWRYAPHDTPLFRTRATPPRPFTCGAYVVGRDGVPRQVLSRHQREVRRSQRYDEVHDRACAKRYRSYDRETDTYLGHDGRRRLCRL